MLKLDNVTKTFGTFKALDCLSLSVPKGAVYGLVGPNGAGKSTVIRHLTGIYQPDSGTVTVAGQPIADDPNLKERIGYISDDVFYFPAATMEDMHRFYRDVFSRFDETLYQKLKEVFPLPTGSIRRFSKGMQKQAAFHLTLSARPDVLILDEPVDGLDPVMRRQVMSLVLSDVAERGTTVLISSHNLRELEDVCDHVGILDHGKMLLEKSLADMQGGTVKLQILGDAPAGFPILHESRSGRLSTFILRGSYPQVEERCRQMNPPYFDVLPLSLEEIFIYELGGVNYEIKENLL